MCWVESSFILAQQPVFRYFLYPTHSGCQACHGGGRLIFPEDNSKTSCYSRLVRKEISAVFEISSTLESTSGGTRLQAVKERERDRIRGCSCPGRDLGGPQPSSITSPLGEIFSDSITRRLPADDGYCTTPWSYTPHLGPCPGQMHAKPLEMSLDRIVTNSCTWLLNGRTLQH